MKKHSLTIMSFLAVVSCLILVASCAHNQATRTASVQVPVHNPTKQEIQAAQEKLNELGYNSGRPDGILGKKTFAAITECQRANDLQVTGQLDAPTMEKLGLGNTQNAPAVASSTSSESGKSGFLHNVGKFYQDTGELFHDFGDRSDNGFLKSISHFGGRIHTAIGDGITQTPKQEGIGGMTKNVVKKGTGALSSDKER